MKCDDVRRAMLEAEPAELGGEGAGTIASHIRECGACRSRATAIVAGTEALQRAVLSRTPGVVVRPSRGRVAIGATAIAACVVAVAALSIRSSSVDAKRHVRRQLPGGVMIDDAQGHEVAVIQSPDTAFTAIIFWNGVAK